ncbi:hypothetical protein ACFQI7_34640 [Paenibacillus allorhizosphaerae]|uniref:Uncharacterized protein n=1 Tax=Paenibacillus allorhizosphaerae TaxID=2849866 RepID=A0ABM8VT33_9BACL|nr:hypothetical protein [Paenibacillus allorhizosphaerae]CAG7657096.1 hypothetical protein PAECIP111802_06613 [Paenibacillus allorhizosphaerae]
MLQRITAGHLERLSEQQKQKLRSWWVPQEGEYIFFSGQEEMIYYLSGVEKRRSLPLLSIGLMMAYVAQQGHTLTVDSVCEEWVVRLSGFEAKASELCDALWDVMISIL